MTLTTEQKTILNAELTNDPKGLGYSAFLPDEIGAIVGILNTLSESKYKTRMITARGILSDYPGGPIEAATVLDKLESGTTSISALKWAFAFLKTSEGLDIGHPATHGMLDQLVTSTIITSTEADNLKNLSLTPISRAEFLGLPYMNVELFLSRNQ